MEEILTVLGGVQFQRAGLFETVAFSDLVRDVSIKCDRDGYLVLWKSRRFSQVSVPPRCDVSG